jgi:putative endonuclease
MGSSGSTGRIELGRRGEDIAADYLISRGYRIIDRNWRCRVGEIDIIAREDAPGRSTIVFCEVKTRSGLGFGGPFDAITQAKARRLRQLVGSWLAEADQHPDDVRIDGIGVLIRPGEQPTLDHRQAIDG